MIVQTTSIVRFICGLLLLSMMFQVGCNGRRAQMERLKRKMAAGSKRSNNDDQGSSPVAKKNQKDPKKNLAQKNESHPKDSSKSGGNLSSQEEQNLRKADPKSAEFLAFRERILARYKEKGNLTVTEKFEAIATAFNQFVAEKRAYPGRAFPNSSPMYSWRVELLPFLGYEELYQQFDFSSPYTSPLNKRLLTLMPPEFDNCGIPGKTSILAPIASYTAYWSARPTRLQRLEDGASATIGFIEYDAEFAVDWTQPKEFPLDNKNLLNGLGGLRDGFFVVGFGDGRIEKVKKGVNPIHFRALLTYDAGDGFPTNVLSPLSENDLQPAVTDVAVNQKQGPKGSVSTGAKNTDDSKKKPGHQGIGPTRPSTNSISMRLEDAAELALSNRRQTRALNLQMASMLIDDQHPRINSFGWSKGLGRPDWAITWTIGIAMKPGQKDTDPIKRAVARDVAIRRPGSKILDEKTGQIGLDAAIVIRNLVQDELMGETLLDNNVILEMELNSRRGKVNQTGKKKGVSNDEVLFDSRKQPDLNYSGVEVLEGPSRSNVYQVARERGSDLLLLLDVDISNLGNRKMNVTTLYVIDVQKGKEIFKSQPFNNLKIRKDREDALKKDSVFTEMKKLDSFCREKLALANMPEGLNRDNILNRLSGLKGKPDKNKLPFLLEARFYLQKRMILLDDYRSFCVDCSGDKEAGVLADGSPQERLRFLSRWLPGDVLVNSGLAKIGN